MAVTIPITKTKITTQWGTSVSADISDLRNTLAELQQTGGGITIETAIDAVAAALKPGNNIDITYDDEVGTLTINVEPLTKADVSLDNVNNTSDADKPISTAAQTALDAKADAAATTSALAGKQPFDTDLTTIAGLDATTDHVIQSFGSAWASRTPAQLKSTLAFTKTDVGLGNVNNTADPAKPVSTATQTALDTKLTTPVWTSYTPVLSVWTLNNGSAIGRYMRIGNLVVFNARIQFGSSSVFTAGNPQITAPFAATTGASGGNRASVSIAFADATGGMYYGRGPIDAALCTPLVSVTGSGYVSDANISSTVPIPWTVNDAIWLSGFYEAA